MRLDSAKQGRRLARRVLLKLDRAGPARCRVERRSQDGALRCALLVLAGKGTREAVAGFARIITDSLGARFYLEPLELAELYAELEREGKLR